MVAEPKGTKGEDCEDYDDNAMFFTVKIALEDPLLSGFHRRGRRKLREMEEDVPDCHLKFEKAGRCLTVSGNLETIEKVRHKVECMTGPRKKLSVPSWAELMRTRMMEGPTSIVGEIQRVTGCRLHIERGSTEVRLFGPHKSVQRADLALERLEGYCSETVVKIHHPDADPDWLVGISKDFHASFRVLENRMVWMMGFKTAVDLAVPTVNRYSEHNITPVPEPGIEESLAELVLIITSNLDLADDVKTDGYLTDGESEYGSPSRHRGSSDMSPQEPTAPEGNDNTVGQIPDVPHDEANVEQAAQSRPMAPAAPSRPMAPAAQSRPMAQAAQSTPMAPAAQSTPEVEQMAQQIPSMGMDQANQLAYSARLQLFQQMEQMEQLRQLQQLQQMQSTSNYLFPPPMSPPSLHMPAASSFTQPLGGQLDRQMLQQFLQQQALETLPGPELWGSPVTQNIWTNPPRQSSGYDHLGAR